MVRSFLYSYFSLHKYLSQVLICRVGYLPKDVNIIRYVKVSRNTACGHNDFCCAKAGVSRRKSVMPLRLLPNHRDFSILNPTIEIIRTKYRSVRFFLGYYHLLFYSSKYVKITNSAKAERRNEYANKRYGSTLHRYSSRLGT